MENMKIFFIVYIPQSFMVYIPQREVIYSIRAAERSISSVTVTHKACFGVHLKFAIIMEKSSKLNAYLKSLTFFFFKKETKRHPDLGSERIHLCGAREKSLVYLHQVTYRATRKFTSQMLYPVQVFVCLFKLT